MRCVKDHVPGAVRPVFARTDLEHVRRPPRRDSRSLLFGDLRRTGGPGDRTEWQVIAVHLPAERPGRRGRPPIWPPRRVIEAIFYLDRPGCALPYPPPDFPPRQTRYHYPPPPPQCGTLAPPPSSPPTLA